MWNFGEMKIKFGEKIRKKNLQNVEMGRKKGGNPDPSCKTSNEKINMNLSVYLPLGKTHTTS